VPEQYVHRIGRTARAGAGGIAIAFCSHDERGNLRDIERTTRQKIPVASLPSDFMAAAEAFKRLKPVPKAQPERSARTHTKADRRHSKSNNGSQQRHGRTGTQDRTGQRRDDQSSQRRTSDRPEAQREALSEQRFPQRADGGQRPNGGQRPPNGSNGDGQPKRKFHGRPRRPGGPRRAQG
jgi:ATP-dependent RNA helicase RhlE